VLAPNPFAHQVNIRLQQRCVVYVGGFPFHTSCVLTVSVFLPGSLLGTTGHKVRSPPSLGVGVLCCHMNCSPAALPPQPLCFSETSGPEKSMSTCPPRAPLPPRQLPC